MSQTDTVIIRRVSVEEIEQGWHDLTLRVAQLEAEREALNLENKRIRSLLDRVIEHRQQSHTELINLLSGLVSKLPINDIGVVVARLVEHNTHVNEVCAALAGGKVETNVFQPNIIRVMDQVKHALAAALGPLVEELIKLNAPIEPAVLRSLATQPEVFSSPAVTRASRGFVKGQVPRERIVREFGEAALVFFTDVTTNPKRNPHPKPDDIMLSFPTNFEAVFEQNPGVIPEKRAQLMELYQRIQRSKAATPEARAQKSAFLRLSFILEVTHFYEHQNTEAPDAIFAQRLPAVVEQLVVANPQDDLDENLITQAESLLAFIVNQDYRLMVINNMGKSGGAGKSLKFVLRLRDDKDPAANASLVHEVIPEFVKHLVTPAPQTPGQQQALAAVLHHLSPELQRIVIKGIMSSDKLRKSEAEALGLTLAHTLKLAGIEEAVKAQSTIPPELERQMAWDKTRDLIQKRGDPVAIANAIRDRLHARYSAEEIKESWVSLIEADAIAFIRTFCQLPYMPDGKTDPIGRTVLEVYVQRLMHEKYASTYTKIVNSLKNMFKAKPDSPTLINFIALVRWVDPAAADKLGADIGMREFVH